MVATFTFVCAIPRVRPDLDGRHSVKGIINTQGPDMIDVTERSPGCITFETCYACLAKRSLSGVRFSLFEAHDAAAHRI
jgi:hypothetical protein